MGSLEDVFFQWYFYHLFYQRYLAGVFFLLRRTALQDRLKKCNSRGLQPLDGALDNIGGFFFGSDVPEKAARLRVCLSCTEIMLPSKKKIQI